MMLDEPFNHLDLGHQASVLRALQAQVPDRRGLLLSVHDKPWRRQQPLAAARGGGGWHAGPREDIATASLLSNAYDHPVVRVETDAGMLFAHSCKGGPAG